VVVDIEGTFTGMNRIGAMGFVHCKIYNAT
jgi:hypothetical protein